MSFTYILNSRAVGDEQMWLIGKTFKISGNDGTRMLFSKPDFDI
jgi:hypothetical protein